MTGPKFILIFKFYKERYFMLKTKREEIRKLKLLAVLAFVIVQ